MKAPALHSLQEFVAAFNHGIHRFSLRFGELGVLNIKLTLNPKNPEQSYKRKPLNNLNPKTLNPKRQLRDPPRDSNIP